MPSSGAEVMSSLNSTVTAQWDDVFQAIEACYELGWTDGLPVVPPTTERVGQFLEYVGREPSELLGEIPERRREITVAKAAANAVMAGCLPQYLPVVLAATEAMLAPEFNLVGPSSSLGGSAILIIVNGPVIEQLNINARANSLGCGRHHRQAISPAQLVTGLNGLENIVPLGGDGTVQATHHFCA